jgi:hypothetical protein
MGDAATDNVVFGADVNSSIIPNTDSTFDLGSASQEWRDLYIDGTAHLDAIPVLIGFAIKMTHSKCPDVSRDMVRKVLKDLQKLEKVVSKGRGLGARWRRKGNNF